MCLLCGCGTRRFLNLVASSTPLSGQSYTVAQTRNLVGIGGTEQVFIIALYSGGNSAIDVTTETTFTSSNPSVVTVSPSGLLEVVAPYCNWISATPPVVNQAGIINVTATWEGHTTTIFVNVNSVAGCPGPATQS